MLKENMKKFDEELKEFLEKQEKKYNFRPEKKNLTYSDTVMKYSLEFTDLTNNENLDEEFDRDAAKFGIKKGMRNVLISTPEGEYYFENFNTRARKYPFILRSANNRTRMKCGVGFLKSFAAEIFINE